MPKVTALKRQKRNKERVNVHLDGEFAFGLHELDAITLRIGQELTATEITTLKDRDAVHQAYERGIRLLSSRPRSVKEIHDNFVRNKIDLPVAEAAVERLLASGYLNDEAFARFWIENRTQFKPRSATALRFELHQKGLTRDIIDPLIEDIVDEYDVALHAAQKKHRRYRLKTEFEYRQKLGAYLQRQGFSFDTVRQVLDHLIALTRDDDPAFFDEGDNSSDS